MASIGEFGASSFDSYEGIRIVIPGIVVFAAGSSAFFTIAPGQENSLPGDTLLSVVASLVVGLILYFWDIPARSAAFAERQPTDYLEDRHKGVAPGVLLTAYLLILNTKMPATVRNRALYMGSMYRIGLEMILAMAMASSMVFGASLFDYGRHTNDFGRAGRLLSAVVLVITFVIALLINKGYERKNAARLRVTPSREMIEAMKNLLHASMVVYALGVVAVVLPNLTILASRLSFVAQRSICASGLALCAGYWVLRYIRGDKASNGDPRKRKRLAAPAAGFLFVLPLVLVLAIYGPGTSTILDSGVRLTGWTAVAALTVMSVMIRGHERKLHGIYSSQKRWLEGNLKEYEDLIPGAATKS